MFNLGVNPSTVSNLCNKKTQTFYYQSLELSKSVKKLEFFDRFLVGRKCFENMKLTTIFGLVATCVQLLSCASKPNSLGAGTRSIMVQKNETLFRNRAIEFLEDVQRGRVNRMIQQTSALTISNTGSDKVKEIYANQVVPSFRNSRIHWNKGHKLVYDEYANTGLTFSGIASGESSFSFYVDVFGENGRLVIMNIRTTPQQKRP